MACRGGAPGRADWDKTHVAALLRARTPRPAAAWSGCHNAHFSSRGEVHSATGGEVWPPAAPRPGAPPRPLSAHFGVSRTLWLFSKYPHPAPGDAPLPPFAASRRSAACRRSMASRLSWEPPQPAFWLSVALWTRGDELPRVSELPGMPPPPTGWRVFQAPAAGGSKAAAAAAPPPQVAALLAECSIHNAEELAAELVETMGVTCVADLADEGILPDSACAGIGMKDVPLRKMRRKARELVQPPAGVAGGNR